MLYLQLWTSHFETLDFAAETASGEYASERPQFSAVSYGQGCENADAATTLLPTTATTIPTSMCVCATATNPS